MACGMRGGGKLVLLVWAEPVTENISISIIVTLVAPSCPVARYKPLARERACILNRYRETEAQSGTVTWPSGRAKIYTQVS